MNSLIRKNNLYQRFLSVYTLYFDTGPIILPILLVEPLKLLFTFADTLSAIGFKRDYSSLWLPLYLTCKNLHGNAPQMLVVKGNIQKVPENTLLIQLPAFQFFICSSFCTYDVLLLKMVYAIHVNQNKVIRRFHCLLTCNNAEENWG